jgi:hypothetical protein
MPGSGHREAQPPVVDDDDVHILLLAAVEVRLTDQPARRQCLQRTPPSLTRSFRSRS